MDILSNLKYAEKSRKHKKRIARGEGSGHGGQSTRGMNGAKSRSGNKYRAWFEGGQMPLIRRIPKRGFTNIFKKYFLAVNLDTIQLLIDNKKIQGDLINASVLFDAGLLRNKSSLFKILGQGELKSKINVEAYAISESAKSKIESIGGSIKIIEN